MKYYVNVLPKDAKTDVRTGEFTRYQDTKRYAKALASDPNNLDVWIEGFENVKSDIDF